MDKVTFSIDPNWNVKLDFPAFKDFKIKAN